MQRYALIIWATIRNRGDAYGKRKITMSIAKRLHSVLGIDANTILDFA